MLSCSVMVELLYDNTFASAQPPSASSVPCLDPPTPRLRFLPSQHPRSNLSHTFIAPQIAVRLVHRFCLRGNQAMILHSSTCCAPQCQDAGNQPPDFPCAVLLPRGKNQSAAYFFVSPALVTSETGTRNKLVLKPSTLRGTVFGNARFSLLSCRVRPGWQRSSRQVARASPKNVQEPPSYFLKQKVSSLKRFHARRRPSTPIIPSHSSCALAPSPASPLPSLPSPLPLLLLASPSSCTLPLHPLTLFRTWTWSCCLRRPWVRGASRSSSGRCRWRRRSCR